MSILALALVAGLTTTTTPHQTHTASTTASGIASVHPNILFVDADEQPVALTGRAISLSRSCGKCHDTAWIEAHSYHASLGADRPYSAGEAPHPWDTFEGPFGRWDPLTYRRLSPPTEARPDATLAEWARLLGPRHVGGGPVKGLEPEAEMNCLLCHADKPNLEARKRSINASQWAWQATATLEGSALVRADGASWTYAQEAFLPNHEVPANLLGLRSARSENCGTCHGWVPPAGAPPLVLPAPTDPGLRPRFTTGLVYSAEHMHESGVNLAGKPELTRVWDVHAERMLQCSDCHGALNDPVHGARDKAERPAHLRTEVRGLGLQDYLRRPQHDFATGYAAPGVLGARLAGTMKRCEDCHDAGETHEWLPYRERHMQAMLCETCHVPKVYAPLLESLDWTVLTPEHGPQTTYRGVDGPPGEVGTLVQGFEPVLLQRTTPGQPPKMAPHNLVTSFYWIQDEPPSPVRLEDLEAAWFEDGHYAPELVAALDQDGDGQLSSQELHLGTPARVAAVAEALKKKGVANPRVVGEIQPYGLNHQVASRGYALSTCESCHGDGSRLTQATRLTPTPPTGVVPTVVKDSPVQLSGAIISGPEGLSLQPDPARSQLYILGQSRGAPIDQIGWAALLLVIIGSLIHGGARIVLAKRAASTKEHT